MGGAKAPRGDSACLFGWAIPSREPSLCPHGSRSERNHNGGYHTAGQKPPHSPFPLPVVSVTWSARRACHLAATLSRPKFLKHEAISVRVDWGIAKKQVSVLATFDSSRRADRRRVAEAE